jgi:hypothetical protein
VQCNYSDPGHGISFIITDSFSSGVGLIQLRSADPLSQMRSEFIMRDQNVREKILAIRELIAHNAKLAAETAAKLKRAWQLPKSQG